MCGRLCIIDNEDFLELFRSLGIAGLDPPGSRYNVAPTQRLDVVTLDAEPRPSSMSWGFSMTVRGKTRPVTRRVSNARSDKVWSSPLWRSAIASHRALVPVTGFYEWRREAGKPVQAYFISPAGQGGMWMAAVCRGGDTPETSIVTTDANEAMSAIHDRMPVTLRSTNEAMAWLQADERDSLDALMAPAGEDALTFTEVSDYVNKSSNEGPRCIEPA